MAAEIRNFLFVTIAAAVLLGCEPSMAQEGEGAAGEGRIPQALVEQPQAGLREDQPDHQQQREQADAQAPLDRPHPAATPA